MVKRKIKQKQEKIHCQNSKSNNKSNLQNKSKTLPNQSVTEKKLRSGKSSSQQMKKSNLKAKKIDQFSQSDQQRQKSSYEVPTKTKKKISKKKKGKSSKSNQKSKGSGIKLQRGYKFCQNCQTVLNIHKYVCTQCGFVHNMKKHKFDVMKNLSKATPKIVKSIIESNQFNTLNLTTTQKFQAFESSFNLKNLFIGKNRQLQISEEKSQCKAHEQGVKRKKSQGKTEKVTNNQSQLINQKIEGKNAQISKTNKIIFKELKITKSNQFSTNLNEQVEDSKLKNQFNKTREQFSIYKSQYPIICMEAIDLPKNQKDNIKSHQVLLFTESVQKKQFFPLQTHLGDILGSNGHQMREENQNGDMMDEQMMDKKSLLRRQQLKQQKVKQEEEKVKLQKLRQNNGLTQKALNLGNYHKIGALYMGQTILNIMSLQKQNKPKVEQVSQNKQQLLLQQTVKRRLSGRSTKTIKNKVEFQSNKSETNKKIDNIKNDNISKDVDNEYRVLRIGLKQHVQMLKTVKNKMAILTGKKTILLMNIDLDWQDIVQQNKIKPTSQLQKQEQNKDNILLWLQTHHFSYLNNNYINQNHCQNNHKSSNKYLSSISLSKQGQIKSQDDQFTVIQWLKNNYMSVNSHLNSNQHDDSYLITGTLYGHIIIYKVSPSNHIETYRAIIGAHFQMVNCLSQCPLNINGTALFASASYDGSVKIWQLNHISPISQFQVSNRKIQSIHWDSGAKFLLIVRDQGLQNCYLACFYSVNNRIQLPMMLTDTIDFRLIRNGLMFDNSCSPLITFPLNSKLVLMLNSRNGFLKILQSQELRKTSLKRKKSKKNYQQLLYHDYWIRLGGNKPIISSSNQINQSINLNFNQQPQIIQMKSNCTDYVNFACAAKAQLQIQQDQPVHIDYMIPQQKNLNNDDQQDSQQNLSKSSNSNHKIQTKKPIKNNPIKINKTKPISQPQPIGIRKSLRARKPNIQYNFMEEEQNQSQKSIQNKKLKSTQKNKIKKKLSSDDEDFQNQSSDQSQQIQNQSDQSFNKNQKKTERNKHLPKKIIEQTKNKQKIQHVKKQYLVRKSLRSRNENKQLQNKKSQGEQMLYKLFWQQTNQQSLVNRKEDFPCNKFPKFSAMASFLTVQSQSQNKTQQQNVKQFDQIKQINKYQNKQNLQTKSQYLTSFIAGYNGELIKVKIKIQGYNQPAQTKQINLDEEEQSD